MNIIHVTHRAWPVIGGSERYVQEVARRQVGDGHRVMVVATDAEDLSALWDGGARRVEPGIPSEHQGVWIRRLPVRTVPLGSVAFFALRRLTWLVSRISMRAALALARFSPWVPELRAVLMYQPADLFFAWNIGLEALTVAVAREAEGRRVPWIAIPLLHLGRPRLYAMRHQLHLLRGATVILAQTERERAFLVEQGLDEERIRVVSPGLDLDQAEQASGARFRQKHEIEGPLLATLGALAYDKGTVHLLAAAQGLWEEGRRLTVALIGPMEKAVQRALSRLPEEQRRHCLHFAQISEEEKWDAVDAADVVALPSRTESYGIVFLEAWARGKPVIGAKAGAVTDVIEDGRDGMLVEFGNVSALADALRTVLDNPMLALGMGQRGRAKVQSEYTWEQRYDQLRTTVHEAIVEWKT